ncbi:Alpha/Beta hydrolase protein [Mycena maculata]|uniref:Alpha/Beta hydrolase protein n=1 Tax=Mycena maculata TaxID=230809 RepID=A0AAD7MSN0_9AGAR|nr:Alpha/Beta hydrolase protein [Mycena maculata]
MAFPLQMRSTNLQYGQLTWMQAPSPSVKQILGYCALRYATTHLSVPQMQFLLGTTLQVYTKWAKQSHLPVVVDELGEDARLMWIGGGYLLPATDFSLSFWRYVQIELEKRGIELDIALLQYSLAPRATFPTPLNQAHLTLEFLIAAGVQPGNLQITGDSAGGNLVLQLLSHILHPRPSVPEIHLAAPIRGAFLMSPWVSLTADSQSHTQCDGMDMLTKRAWGRQILADFPETEVAFSPPAKAPESWFKGVDGAVDRVLITAGGAECLHDDIVEFSEGFKKQHCNVEGLHGDTFLDFFTGEKKLGSLTPVILDWIAPGFNQ